MSTTKHISSEDTKSGAEGSRVCCVNHRIYQGSGAVCGAVSKAFEKMSAVSCLFLLA